MNAPVPIIGQPQNERAIKILEALLEGLRRGELVNIAAVAERRSDGQCVMSFDADQNGGHAVKLCGALGLLRTSIEQKLLGG